MVMTVVIVAVDEVPLLGSLTVYVVGVDIRINLEFFKLKSTMSIEVEPLFFKSIILELLVAHTDVFVDDHVLIEALEHHAIVAVAMEGSVLLVPPPLLEGAVEFQFLDANVVNACCFRGIRIIFGNLKCQLMSFIIRGGTNNIEACIRYHLLNIMWWMQRRWVDVALAHLHAINQICALADPSVGIGVRFVLVDVVSFGEVSRAEHIKARALLILLYRNIQALGHLIVPKPELLVHLLDFSARAGLLGSPVHGGPVVEGAAGAVAAGKVRDFDAVDFVVKCGVIGLMIKRVVKCNNRLAL